MRGEVNKATEDVTIDSNIEKQKTILTNTYSNLLKEQKKIKQLKMDIEQYTAETEDQLSVPSVQMHHMIWQ